MRQIEASSIAEVVSRLSQEANFELGNDVISALRKAASEETSPLGKEALKVILENAEIAAGRGCHSARTVVLLLFFLR